jgi:segregation and condensation protein B
MSPWVSRLWEEKPARYSRALLETLVLIAYKQPITRGEIEHVRGVAVSTNIIKTLLEREWVRVVGHRDVPGKPALYATTKSFLDYFNLKSLEELPTLAEIRDLDKINAELELEEPGAPTDEQQATGETQTEEGEAGDEGKIGEPAGEAGEGETSDEVEDVEDETAQLQQDEIHDETQGETQVEHKEELIAAETQDAIDPGEFSSGEIEIESETAVVGLDDTNEDQEFNSDDDDSSEDIDSNLDDRDVVTLDNVISTDTSSDTSQLEDDETLHEETTHEETMHEHVAMVDEPDSHEGDDVITSDLESATQHDEVDAGEEPPQPEPDQTHAVSSDDMSDTVDAQTNEQYHQDGDRADGTDREQTSPSDQNESEIKSQVTSDGDKPDDPSSDKLETAMADDDGEYSISDDYDSRFGG